MAKEKKERKEQVTKEEQQVMGQMETLKKQIGDKTPTDKQKEQMSTLRETLGKLRFVRIANKRIPKTLAAINGIANLSGPGYIKSPEQVKAIVAALKDAVQSVEQKLSGAKAAATGFQLPGFEQK